VSDKYDANEDSALSGQVIRKCDRELKDAADVVLYSGRKLFREATEPNRYFLEQAVDFEHFSELKAERVPELAGIPHPILGYFGSMDYVMDTELMAEVARLRPGWHWVLLGLKSNLIRITAPNIHFLGAKPYGALPQYIPQFDVCVLPWRETNTFTSYGSAIKVREYLATGKPVVMAPLYEYLETPGLRFYRGTQEFIAQIEAALREDTPALAAQRQAVVKDGTWDERAGQLAALINSLLHGQRYRFASAELHLLKEGH
jgi:glycosyltransferase involved in cell wall biosynthesis